MKNFTFTLFCVLCIIFQIEAQSGFTSITNLNSVTISANTGEKPQAKVWEYAGRHWAVLANSSGTHLWRLDGTNWTNVLRLSTRNTSKADTKVVGNIVHILLFQGVSSQLVSVEYSAALGTYQLWSQRNATVTINLPSSVEIANLDIDGNGRMWIAYDGSSQIYATWSDSPYQNWSSPITVATGLSSDDIGAIIALPGRIGVFWSNQRTERYGFKTHTDGANPSSWSGDEVPASQSALNVGDGMADDHLNMAVSSNGTLFCAVKTSYNSSNYPEIALLVRRPNGNWDNLYRVSSQGTRPIVILNEAQNKLRVVYTQVTGGGNIVYNESSLSNISFGNQLRLISGSYNNPTSSKGNFTSEVVILASSNSRAVGVLARDGQTPTIPISPQLSTPADLATNVSVTPSLTWQASQGATSYRAQVSSAVNFSTSVFDQNNITTTTASVTGLANSSVYYWRVLATNTAGDSQWSSIRSFTTTAGSTLLSPPVLSSPADLATNVSAAPTLSWSSSEGAASYRAQVSSAANFATSLFDQGGITGTSTSVSGLANNTLYYWRVLASNTTGDSEWSTPRSFTTASGSSSATLAAHWRMDEGSGTNVSDISSYANNATTTGNPTWLTGVAGQALRFNGSNQYATAPDNASLDISSSITMATWIRPERSGTQYMIKKGGQDGVDGYELSLANAGTVFFRFNQESSGNSYRVDSQISYPTDGNTWMHVAATYDGAVIRMYINGVENSSRAVSGSPQININALALSIGAGNNGYRGFQGALDEIYLYNTALSASEINALASVTSTLRMASSESVILKEVKLPEEEIKDKFFAYPNPFSSEVSVSFILPTDAAYSLALYDSRGAKLTELREGKTLAGEINTVAVNASWLSTGLYLVRLQTDRGETKTIRLIRR